MPLLPEVPDLAIEPMDGGRLIGAVSDIDAESVRRLITQHHMPYLARIAGEAVGYGWVASRTAEIGELGVTLTLAPDERYLWDFVTLPTWRGRGIYPRILQQMLVHEAPAVRFWIGHDRPNVASGRGILTAGFQLTVELYVEDDRAYLLPVGPLDRAEAAAALLGFPLVAGDAGPIA